MVLANTYVLHNSGRQKSWRILRLLYVLQMSRISVAHCTLLFKSLVQIPPFGVKGIATRRGQASILNKLFNQQEDSHFREGEFVRRERLLFFFFFAVNNQTNYIYDELLLPTNLDKNFVIVQKILDMTIEVLLIEEEAVVLMQESGDGCSILAQERWLSSMGALLLINILKSRKTPIADCYSPRKGTYIFIRRPQSNSQKQYNELMVCQPSKNFKD